MIPTPARDSRSGRFATALICLAALAGCEAATPAKPPAQGPDAVATVRAPSSDSAAMRLHYEHVQSSLLSQGLMRTDGGGRDTPFTERQLVDNFIRIALYDEYVSRAGVLVPRATASRLRRWEHPVRMSVEFGPSIPLAQRDRDRTDIGAYAARLSRVSGLPIVITDATPNFYVMILNEDERRAAGPRLAEMVPGIDGTSVASITGMDPSTFCVVFAFSNGSSPVYSRAIAVIRGEHPDALRLSCIHEELAQGLGLANDSPAARPSIFNDDEEFALLTRQDELMLKILYDPRLRPGMTPEEARPIVETIAHELIGGES